MYKKNISISAFTDSKVDLSKFLSELEETSIYDKITGSMLTSRELSLSLSSSLTQVELDLLDVKATEHLYIAPTELEKKAEGIRTSGDYVIIREAMKIIATNFNILSDKDKDIASKYCLVSQNLIVPYYMSKGMSLEEASLIYKKDRAVDIRSAARVYSDRIRSVEFTVAVMTYLGQNNGEIFLDNCRNFISDLKETAILGTQYGNTMDGFFDYIEDTGSYVGTGLSGFFTLPDEQVKLTVLIKSIKDIVYYGYVT